MALKYKRLKVKFDSQSVLKTNVVKPKKTSYILNTIKYIYLKYSKYVVGPSDSFDFWNTVYFDYYYDNSLNGSAKVLRATRYFLYLYIDKLYYWEYTFVLTNINYIMNLMASGFVNRKLEFTKVFFYWKDFYFFYNSYSNIINLFVYDNFKFFDSNIVNSYKLNNLYIRNIIRNINFDSFLFLFLTLYLSLVKFTINNLNIVLTLFLRYILKFVSFFKSRLIKYRFVLLIIFINHLFVYIFKLFTKKIFKFSLFFFFKKNINELIIKMVLYFYNIYFFVVAFILRFSEFYLNIKNLIEHLFIRLYNNYIIFIFSNKVNYWFYLNKMLNFISKIMYNLNFYKIDKQILNEKSFSSLGDLYIKYLFNNSKAFWWLSYDNSTKNIFNYNITIHKSLVKYFTVLYNYTMSDIVIFTPVFAYILGKVKEKDIVRWERYSFIGFRLISIVVILIILIKI